MHGTKSISVIMPAHNAQKTIRWAIFSLLISLPRNSEILVFLDGCNDKTEQILKSFKSSRIKIVTSTTKVGVARALNALLDIAEGDYIARLDADDIALPWRFFRFRQLAEKADFVFSSQINFTNRSWLLTRQPIMLPFNDSEIVKTLLVTNTLTHSSLLAKRSAVTQLGGYHEVPAEDYNLWLRAIENGYKLRKTWVPKVLFRVHPGQITKSRDWIIANSKSQENKDLVQRVRQKESATMRPPRFFQNLYIKRLIKKTEGIVENSYKKGNYFVSLLDSIFWRLGTLVLTLTVASLFPIEQYALYASGALITTFFQGLIEGVLRLQQVSQFEDFESSQLAKKYSKLTLFGSLCLLPLLLLLNSLNIGAGIGGFLELLPFCLALPVIRFSTLRQLRLQAYDRWKELLVSRLLAVVSSLALLVPLLLFTKSVAVSTASLMITELLFLGFVSLNYRDSSMPQRHHPYLNLISQRRYFDALETQTHLWLRNQLDRILVVAFAGPKLIALYLLAFTVGRTPSETLSAGANRYLKSVELKPSSPATYKTLRRNIFWVQLATVMFSLLIYLCIPWLLVFAPAQWADSIRALPIFIASTIPSILSASLFEFKFRNRPVFKYWQLYSLSIVTSLMIAATLNLYGLAFAGIALVAKESIMATYWYRSSEIPKGSWLATQTTILGVVALSIAWLSN